MTARCAYDLVGEDFHAAVGVVDDEPLARAVQLMGDHQRADRVVARSFACVPDHVLERHPDGFVAQPGYVWLDMPGKVWHVGEHELEFR